MHTDMTSSAGSRSRVILLTAGTLFALSPVLLDWTLHLIDFPSARYAAIFPVLFLIGIRSHPGTRPRPDGYLWLAAALLVEVACIGGGFPRWGRGAVPLAMIGLCRASGLTSARGACLMLWFVPVPHFLGSAIWPEVILLFTETAAWILPPFDLELSGDWLVASKDGLRLVLNPSDVGLSLLAGMSGLAYFVGWQRSEFPIRTLGRMATWSLIAVPVQWTAILLALWLLQWGEPDWGRILLWAPFWCLGAVFLFRSLGSGPRRSNGINRTTPSVPSA